MATSPLSSLPDWDSIDPFTSSPPVYQEPIITHLRPRRKRTLAPSPQTTPSRRQPSKRARQQLRNRSPTPAREPSLYRVLEPLSLYVFDDDFYNQGQILNRSVTPSGATYGVVLVLYSSQFLAVLVDLIVFNVISFILSYLGSFVIDLLYTLLFFISRFKNAAFFSRIGLCVHVKCF